MFQKNNTRDTASVFVLPLGGTNRVGLNMTLIGHGGRWIIADAGATFVNSENRDAIDYAASMGGVFGAIIPDLRSISHLIKKVDGIVITHAHEDHIGALKLLYEHEALWPGFSSIPVHATPYTAEILRDRLSQIANRPKISNIKPGHNRHIGTFLVEWVKVTHSAPETAALAIKTGAGRIVLASDFKIDDNPVVGETTDTDRFQELGREGVLAFLGDSTNAGKSGRTVSEGDVGSSISAIAKGFEGQVFLTSFSSNLARAETARMAANASGREFHVVGRSLHRNLGHARSVGFLDGAHHKSGHVVPANSDRRLVLCSGSQGEPGSALVKIAENLASGKAVRGYPSIGAGDLLIHSARVIPGNEKTVHGLFDLFRRYGVHVVTPDDNITGVTVHASGHAYEDEMQDVYRMLKPRFAAPIHGDRSLIASHLEFAKSQKSVQKAISPEEGEMLEITPGKIEIVGRMKVSTLAEIRTSNPEAPVVLAPWPPVASNIAA